jgi:calpain-7
VREISAADAGTTTNLRLVLVKNPWARRRWLGNYSPTDQRHWTPKLKLLLNFDTDLAQSCDNGIFWIDWSSLLKYFRSIHLNWNPGLFKYRTLMHHHWSLQQGPAVDSFNYGPNPQFTLTVKSGVVVVVVLDFLVSLGYCYLLVHV